MSSSNIAQPTAWPRLLVRNRQEFRLGSSHGEYDVARCSNLWSRCVWEVCEFDFTKGCLRIFRFGTIQGSQTFSLSSAFNVHTENFLVSGSSIKRSLKVTMARISSSSAEVLFVVAT